MNEDIHGKARRSILEARIEDLEPGDQVRLDEHLKNCPECRQYRDMTDAALHTFKNSSVLIDPNLLRSTQRRVQARAKDLDSGAGLNPFVAWITTIVTLVWIAVTMPYIWRGFEWIGTRLGMPDLVWQMNFGLWWLLPALVIAAVVAAQTDRSVIYKENETNTDGVDYE